MKPRRVSEKQRRKLRAGITAEVRRYRACLDLVTNLPANVVDAGLELFVDEAALALWLCEPARALGDKIPMRVAQTRRGANQVTQVLRAILYGVYL
jgi:uncharacterized protein (DUF2384 family)